MTRLSTDIAPFNLPAIQFSINELRPGSRRNDRLRTDLRGLLGWSGVGAARGVAAILGSNSGQGQGRILQLQLNALVETQAESSHAAFVSSTGNSGENGGAGSSGGAGFDGGFAEAMIGGGSPDVPVLYDSSRQAAVEGSAAANVLTQGGNGGAGGDNAFGNGGAGGNGGDGGGSSISVFGNWQLYTLQGQSPGVTIQAIGGGGGSGGDASGNRRPRRARRRRRRS